MHAGRRVGGAAVGAVAVHVVVVVGELGAGGDVGVGHDGDVVVQRRARGARKDGLDEAVGLAAVVDEARDVAGGGGVDDQVHVAQLGRQHFVGLFVVGCFCFGCLGVVVGLLLVCLCFLCVLARWLPPPPTHTTQNTNKQKQNGALTR